MSAFRQVLLCVFGCKVDIYDMRVGHLGIDLDVFSPFCERGPRLMVRIEEAEAVK